MKRTAVVAALVLACAAARADQPPLAETLTPEQAQARQFGIFFGGTASTFDLCVRKGFLAKENQSAEDTARSVIDRMRASNKGPDQTAYVQDGWETMKKEISENEAFYTQDKCVLVGKEWNKILVSMKKS